MEDRLRIDYICNSLGKNPVYGVTITDQVMRNYVNAGKDIYKWQKFEYKGLQNID